MVATKFKSEIEKVCLIFAGKILKDNETLDTHSKSGQQHDFSTCYSSKIVLYFVKVAFCF